MALDEHDRDQWPKVDAEALLQAMERLLAVHRMALADHQRCSWSEDDTDALLQAMDRVLDALAQGHTSCLDVANLPWGEDGSGLTQAPHDT